MGLFFDKYVIIEKCKVCGATMKKETKLVSKGNVGEYVEYNETCISCELRRALRKIFYND